MGIVRICDVPVPLHSPLTSIPEFISMTHPDTEVHDMCEVCLVELDGSIELSETPTDGRILSFELFRYGAGQTRIPCDSYVIGELCVDGAIIRHRLLHNPLWGLWATVSYHTRRHPPTVTHDIPLYPYPRHLQRIQNVSNPTTYTVSTGSYSSI